MPGSKEVRQTGRDMSKEHRSALDGTPTGQIGDDLSGKRDNDNNNYNTLNKERIHESIGILKWGRETPFCTEECQVTNVGGMVVLQKSLLCNHQRTN